MNDRTPGDVSDDGEADFDPSRTFGIHSLFARQRAAATRQDGSVDMEVLSELVVERYLRSPVAIQARASHFRAVLENIAQGVCLFDKKQRLIICNQRYAEIYGLEAKHVRPGTTLREIIERRHAAGSTPAMTPDEYFLWREKVAETSKPDESAVELQDGRVIAIRHQPMPHGGWVATHEDITDRLKTEHELAYLARHFSVTGLPNRTIIAEQLQEVLSRPSRMGPCAVLALGLDGVQAVSDTLGHPAGDTLVRTLAERLRTHLSPADLLGQLSPTNFAVIQSETSQPAEAVHLARRLLNLLGEPVTLVGQQVFVGVNVGIAVAVQDGSDGEVLLHNAGVALHRATTDGRGRYRVFEPEMDAWVEARRSLETDLREAVDGMAFELHYQPQFNLETRKVSRFEALLRWTHPRRGPVAPDVFIPVAEDIGLIERIGEWTLRRACTDATRWPGWCGVAVNISALQLKDRALPKMVASALGDSGLPPSRLELELTETSFMKDPSAGAAVLAGLRSSGVTIALDDFGTGYSSLSYLPNLPFDKIKIDKSFITKLEDGRTHQAVVRAIIGLSASLGVVCTAEGVETEAQLAFLTGENCTEVQGYLLGRPGPERDIPDLLRTSDLRASFTASRRPDGSSTNSNQASPVEDPGELLFQQIVETANDVIIVTDAHLELPGPRIIYVNPAFTRLSGYAADEALGRSPRMLQGPGTSRATLDEIASGLRAGRPVHQKVLNFAKCGAPYWLDLRIMPWRDHNGHITRFIAIERDVTLDKRRLDELEYAADRDILTGIPNRRALLRSTDAELQAARTREAVGPCLAFVDVDHFKRINDEFGHAAGDAVLSGIADRIAENVRRVDTPGRIGGEEFAICMPSIKLREAAAIGERLRQAVAAKHFETLSGPLRITVSVGVAEAARDEHNLTDLMERADRAMYAAKRLGRNCVATEPDLSTVPAAENA